MAGRSRGLIVAVRRHRVAFVLLALEGMSAGVLALPVFAGEKGTGSHIGLAATMGLFAATALQVIGKSGRDIVSGQKELAESQKREDRALRVVTDVQSYFFDRVPSLLDYLGTLLAADSAEDRKAIVESMESLVVDSAASLYGNKDLRAVVLHYGEGALLPGNFKRGFEPAAVPSLRDSGRVTQRALQLLQDKKTLWVDAPDDARHSDSLILRPTDAYRSFIRVPLIAGDYGFGLLWVDGRNDRSLMEADVAPLTTLAGFLAAALAVVTDPDRRVPCSM